VGSSEQYPHVEAQSLNIFTFVSALLELQNDAIVPQKPIVSIQVGLVVGETVGYRVGKMVGFLDGIMVGEVGDNVGDNVGRLLGLRVELKQVPHETGQSS